MQVRRSTMALILRAYVTRSPQQGHQRLTWSGGVLGRGACMTRRPEVQRGVHGRGACMAMGHAWLGGMHGCGVCVAGETATASGRTHPTGIHSCHADISFYTKYSMIVLKPAILWYFHFQYFSTVDTSSRKKFPPRYSQTTLLKQKKYIYFGTFIFKNRQQKYRTIIRIHRKREKEVKTESGLLFIDFYKKKKYWEL